MQMRLINQYLQRAKEAEVRATMHHDLLLKNEWLEIANGYRNLAQARQGFIIDESAHETFLGPGILDRSLA